MSASPTPPSSSASLPLVSFPASASLPTSVPSTSRRRGTRRQRSPGHNRVPLWDTVRGKKLSGFASPMEKNLKRYLDEHPNCVLYDRNIHRVGARNGEAGKEAEEDEEEEEEEEVPAELERIISSSPHSSSPLSRSPKNSARVSGALPPIRGQAGRQQHGADAIPRSMPMPVLSSSLPSHINIPPPLSSSVPNSSCISPSAYSPNQSPNASPQHSPSAKIAIKFEQLTMSASTNSLSSLASVSSATSSPGKLRKSGKKLTQSPRHNKPILLGSGVAVAPSVAMEGSARSTVISRRMGTAEEASSGYSVDGAPVMAAAAVHPPPYHPALSVSVPLPSFVPQSASTRPLTVETHFEGHSPSHSHSHYPHPHAHQYPQLHSSTLSRSTTCSPSHSSSSHVDPFSASSLNPSPRRKAKHARAHPYHGDRTPRHIDGRGRLEEEAQLEYKESARVGWSHSLPNTGPHSGMYAPLIEATVDEIGNVCTCGGAQQYAAEGYYVQHTHGDPMLDVGLPVGYHGGGGMDVHHVMPAGDVMDDHAVYGHHQLHTHPHSHSHPHLHSHSHNHASQHAHYHSHAHAHHHALAGSSMYDNPPLRILSPVNGLSSAHSVSSESTHSSSSSNPSSKHLVFSRPMSPSQPLSAHTSHSRTSPPLPAPATALYAVEYETKADGQTVVHHHHHYQVPGPVVSPSAWLAEGGVDDRVMTEDGHWATVSYKPSTHPSSSLSPPPQHAQYMAVSVSPTPHHARLDDELYLAPTDHNVAAVQEYDLAAFDFTQLH